MTIPYNLIFIHEKELLHNNFFAIYDEDTL